MMGKGLWDSPEGDLVLACARAELAASDRERIERRISAGVDWARVGDLATRHELVPLVYRHLRGRDDVPGELLERWESLVLRHSARGRMFLNALVDTVALLRSDRIPVVAFKGPSLALAA